MEVSRSLCKWGFGEEIKLVERMDEEWRGGVRVLISGDFNARTGREGRRMREEEEGRNGEEGRTSRDEKINREGKKLCGYMGELGWSILNSNVKGNEEGEWAYTRGKGGTVIDCVEERRDKREGEKDEGGELGGLRSSADNGMGKRRRR